MPEEEFNLFDAQAFMIEHDCYISPHLMNPDGSVSRDIIEKLNEYPFRLHRENTRSSLVVTILAYDSMHVLDIIEQDFPGWKLHNQ